MPGSLDRSDPVAAARIALWLTIGWNCVAGLGALIAGVASGNIALGGHGANAILDTAASSVLVWRFRTGVDDPGDRSEAVARRWILVAIVGIAVVIGAQAIRALSARHHPDATAIGTAALIGSALFLAPLAIRKLHLARMLGSDALRGDGLLTAASWALSVATLLGIALDRTAGWWWATHAAALLIAGALLAEGWALARPSRASFGLKDAAD